MSMCENCANCRSSCSPRLSTSLFPTTRSKERNSTHSVAMAPRGRWLWSAKAASKRRGSRSLHELGAVCGFERCRPFTQSVDAADGGFVGRAIPKGDEWQYGYQQYANKNLL